ncbi:MAG: DMT family transporter, partial [Deltaproteobacteria bacterium]|nr:DMT family transporter [Deltaproteobacteria bacterium]
MALAVMFLVLFGAALHATWNVIIKAGSDKQLDTLLVICGAAIIAPLALPFVPTPAKASWPYLGASVGIHFAYFILIALAYRTGDLSYAYPIMRGSAPLLTAVVAAVTVREPLSIGAWVGIGLISAGIFTLTGDSWRSGRFPFASTVFGLLNAVVIMTYTIVDGLGIRLSGNAFSYILWLFLLIPIPLLLLTLLTRPKEFRAQIRFRWKAGFFGGMCTAASYGLALWAMTIAPIALVAGLRETSVIFGTVFAGLFLKERFGFLRYVAAGLVTMGGIA